MTPMKRYRAAITQFKNVFLNAGFQESTLNGGDPKYNPHGGEHGFGGHSKGVANDFTLLLKYNNQFSVGLVFNYKEDPVQVEATLCPMKSRVNERGYEADVKKMESSPVYTPEEFSKHINDFNKVFKTVTNTRNPEKVLRYFKECFKVDNIDLDAKVSLADKKIKDFLQDKVSNVDNKKKEAKKAEDALKRAENKVKKDYTESDEYVELQALRKRERELLGALMVKDDALKTKYKVEEKSQNYKKATEELESVKADERIEKENVLKEFPKVVRERVIRNR